MRSYLRNPNVQHIKNIYKHYKHLIGAIRIKILKGVIVRNPERTAPAACASGTY
jgi:hypothetical protein